MLLHKKHVSKRIEKPTIPHNELIHMILQKLLIFPVFTTSRDVVRKYAKGEEVFVKKNDNSHSALNMAVLALHDEAVTVS